MKAYLAAPIFNRYQLAVVEGIKLRLEINGFEIFSPYHASQAIWAGRAPKDCSPEERAQVLKGNIDNLDDCDVLVAWVGGYDGGFTDPGVIWEMGYVKALQRRTPGEHPFTLAYIDMTDTRQSMNLMLAGTVDAVTKGWDELEDALELLPHNPSSRVAELYHPDRHIAQEKEPIV